MIRVRVPEEITEYKAKILFGLTVRQLLFGAAAIFVGVFSFFLIRKLGFDLSAAGYMVMFISMPLLAFGFIQKNGMGFEKLIQIILHYKNSPAERIYKTHGENNYESIKKSIKHNAKQHTASECDKRVEFGKQEDKRRGKIAKAQAARIAKERRK